MNQLLTTLMALVVASATGFAHAQAAPAAAASAGAVPLQARIAMCVGCHNIPGYQASFPEVHKVPMIAGQSAAYIEAALGAYKTGERRHPTMRSIADSLSEQDIKEIAAYYAKLGTDEPVAEQPSRQPGAQVGALLQKGACVSCHGANFSKPIAPNYPKIAGQHRDYLFVALKSYKADPKGPVGRGNAVMGGIAKQFGNAELKAMADYIGSLDGELETVPESRFHK
ncbi:c-type cytochrome [Ramlibacter tataouinensis]|uniref:c-type cytochrome n=1 Tax=Ramlibacter tataouinensis TaxID=94132 RepID=UPI0022F3F940|nr:c-type cytochrome [Ramlibacter tataouinensis]WBY03691.1 c-type cytochrome [Ramlibacter tataouinensis]